MSRENYKYLKNKLGFGDFKMLIDEFRNKIKENNYYNKKFLLLKFNKNVVLSSLISVKDN